MNYTNLLQPIDKQVEKCDEPLPKKNYLIWLIAGAKGKGKSSLILNSLLHPEFYKNYYDNIYLVSPTADKDPKFDKLVSELQQDNHFFNEPTQENIQEIIDNIKVFNDNFSVKKKKRQPRNLIILDDCVTSLPKSNQKSIINHLIISHRHLKTSIFITTQSFKKLNTIMRANADLISFFQNDNKNELKGFQEEYSIKDEYMDKLKVSNDFLHVSFCSGKKKVFYKFDELV
jgi:hypothetical protein